MASSNEDDIPCAFIHDGFSSFKPGVSGRFNLLNFLAATATALTLGISLDDITEALSTFKGVPGRYQKVSADNVPYTVFVDYAHNPQSVEAILNDAKTGNFNRVIAIIGCGGDRDREKRPLMGRIAIELADELIITSDNPRSEEPSMIIDEIIEGVEHSGLDKPYHVEPDREKAIALGVSRLKEKDALFILGKGHEEYQILSTGKIRFSDSKIARKYIARRLRSEDQGGNS